MADIPLMEKKPFPGASGEALFFRNAGNSLEEFAAGPERSFAMRVKRGKWAVLICQFPWLCFRGLFIAPLYESFKK